MNDELKACPFCGAKLTKSVVDRETFYQHPMVNGCHLRAMLFTKDKWNTRPIEDALEARVADLEAKLDKWQDCYFEFESIAPDGTLKISVLDLYNRLTDREARVAELEVSRRWIPVGERLPEFGTSILFYDSILEKINKGTCTALGGNKNNLQWYTDDNLFYHGNRCEYITHWMPLPEVPNV